MPDQERPGPEASTHYDPAYFDWQQESGKLGGWANVDKYRKSTRQSDRILDFGCGGGFLLANLDCSERFGIEPNAAAREVAVRNGVQVYPSASEALEELGAQTIDLIISDNALEHALEPYRELIAIRPLLRPGGRLHLVVPCESIHWRYDSTDVNQHVYSWSPQSLGNLVTAAGYEVEYSRPYIHKWPPRIAKAVARLGRPVFNAVSRTWGHLDRRWFQVEVLAVKPALEDGALTSGGGSLG